MIVGSNSWMTVQQFDAFLSLAEASQIQSVVFDKDSFTKESAISWLKKNKFKTDVDEKEDTYRFRQKPPKFKRYRMIPLRAGVKAVVGFKEDEDRIQS